jgi:hypothetical protein
MANATAITIRDFVANGQLTDPTADTFDTGTAAVTVPIALTSKTDRFMLRVTNTAAATLTVSMGAGTDPPGFRSGVGAFTGTAQGVGNVTPTVAWYGPFESSRFVDATGNLNVTLTPTSGTIAATAQGFRLPKV